MVNENGNPDEQFQTARYIEVNLNVPRWTLYAMAKGKIVPSYRVGAKRGGIRFIPCEVKAALKHEATE